MYSDLHVHTTETLQAIEAHAQQFGKLVQVSEPLAMFILCLKSELFQEYEKVTQQIDPNAKSWNFLKIHLLKHMARDIMEKGATCNYNTKLNEKMYSSLKDSYQLCTNFKDVAEQVCQAYFGDC